jgi:hypothetical protein
MFGRYIRIRLLGSRIFIAEEAGVTNTHVSRGP